MTCFVAHPVINPREFVLIADVLTASVFTNVARGEAEGNVRHTKTTIAAKVSSGIFGAVKVAIALNASTIVITEILVGTVTGVEAWARECLITERFAVPTQSNFTRCGWITLRGVGTGFAVEGSAFPKLWVAVKIHAWGAVVVLAAGRACCSYTASVNTGMSTACTFVNSRVAVVVDTIANFYGAWRAARAGV